ncbi:hypothetical protein [Paenibacillus sp. USHLN196]|uniref:hypothetical protein n=1 Tax=Paenibacillus sp. USHLN196 TaxID=3081291 RepID=UPI00301B6389
MFNIKQVSRLRSHLQKEIEDIIEEKKDVFNRLDEDPTNMSLKDREAFLTGVDVGLLKAQRLINKVYGEDN